MTIVPQSTLEPEKETREPQPEDFGLSLAEVEKIRDTQSKEGVPSWFGKLYFFILFGGMFAAAPFGKEGFMVWLPVWVVALIFYMNDKKIFAYRVRRPDFLPEAYKRYVAAKYEYADTERREKERLDKEERARQEKIREERRKDFEYWSSIDPYEFEREIAALFRNNGFRAQVTKGSGDGGIDIILYKGDQKGVVQCKRQKTKVSPGVVRDLYGTMKGGGFGFGFVVCPASFSDKSYEFSKGKKIGLIGLKRIVAMVNQKDVAFLDLE